MRSSQLPDRQPALELAPRGRPARRGRRAWARAGSARSGRSRTACCAPSTRTRARRRPRVCASAATVKRIITSGPQTARPAPGGSNSARSTSRGTTPTWPSHSGPALSTVTATSSPRRGPLAQLVGDTAAARASDRRRAAPGARSARGGRAARGSPGAAAPGRSPPATTRTSRARELRDRPGTAERAAHAEHVARAASQIACVARPTARTVCTRGPSPPGSPLIEIGTSPLPNAESIVNCPGANASALPGCAARARASTCRRSPGAWPATANGAGTIGPRLGRQRRLERRRRLRRHGQ